MLGPWQIAIILILVLVLFGGRGKITSIMGDMASGIKAFRKGLTDEDEAKKPEEEPSKSLSQETAEPVQTAEKTKAE